MKGVAPFIFVWYANHFTFEDIFNAASIHVLHRLMRFMNMFGACKTENSFACEKPASIHHVDIWKIYTLTRYSPKNLLNTFKCGTKQVVKHVHTFVSSYRNFSPKNCNTNNNKTRKKPCAWEKYAELAQHSIIVQSIIGVSATSIHHLLKTTSSSKP